MSMITMGMGLTSGGGTSTLYDLSFSTEHISLEFEMEVIPLEFEIETIDLCGEE